MEPEAHAPIPSIALPFGLVGATAVVFSLVGLTAVRIGPERVDPAVAVASGAAAGIAVGAVLKRWPAVHSGLSAREIVAFRVALPVILAGGAIGAVLGVQAWGTFGLAPFTLGGAVAAVAFVPACLTVLEAGRRAARARLGSLVAGADKRTIWATALSSISVISLVGVPALLAGCSAGRLSVPQQASLVLGVGVACALGATLLAWRDRVGISRLRELRSQPMEEASATTEQAIACVDVGLGDAAWSSLGSAGTYRTATRGEILLRGDVEAAIDALEEAHRSRSKAQGLAALSIVVTLATCFASDIREVGAEGCFRRVRAEVAGCDCVEKSEFRPVWPK